MSILFVSGCTQVTTTSISTERSLPKKIEKILEENPIDKENSIQLFFNGKDTYYIVYETNKQIDEFPLYSDTVDSEVIINIIEGEEQDKISRYIFKLKSDIKYTTINLELNGTPAPFDVVTQY